jgi:2-aminophenol/2-amino-5-chlorophenol 1,6-dioxygenase alpha subunit
MANSRILGAWVPGLPHILKPTLNENYKLLSEAMTTVGRTFHEQGVSRILYYSTQWLSVLGQSVQTKETLRGSHVDENWYDFGSLDFSFKTDLLMANAVADGLSKNGFQTKKINFEGFPIDTGTIVANKLVNPNQLPTGTLSCCVYSDFLETVNLGQSAKSSLENLGGTSAVVVVSGLSGRYFTTEIDPREDHISSREDDVWNKKILALMSEGRWDEVYKIKDQYCKEAKVDMGFKALAFLEGLGLIEKGRTLKTLAYGPVYGTGASVMMAH